MHTDAANDGNREMTILKKQSMGFAFSMLLPVVAAAQTTTLSIEATAINGTPLPNGPAARVVASPGDIIDAKFWVRDWSPEGQILRSYQITLDPAGFLSGPAGKVAPIGYDDEGRTDNKAASFLGESDPDFIHKGEHIIPLVHAIGTEYKWISVVFDSDTGPVSKQDGTKKSCGLVKLQVSDDARGEFTITVIKDRELTMFNDPKNNKVEPLNFEPLSIDVPEAGRWARIGSSIPPAGAIDARIAPEKSGSAWTTIMLISSGDASALSPSDFTVTDGTNNPPVIKKMEVSESSVTLHLDRAIRSKRWTVVTHTPSASATRVAHLPGDVNNDGRSDTNDIAQLIESLNGGGTLSLFQIDLNTDGTANTEDLATLIHFLADPSTRDMRIKG
jgi:Dockerin type I domain